MLAVQEKTGLSAKEKILRAAHDLFYADGIKATGIDKIIAASGVTKVTFYRHFPSKNQLILSYLDYRHALWMGWFTAALSARLAAGDSREQALAAALCDWFSDADFRGCAFINATAESGELLEDVKAITRRHKDEMRAVISQQLHIDDEDKLDALVLIIDGAIVQAQIGKDPLRVTALLRNSLAPMLTT